MSAALANTCCARLPAGALPWLGQLRCRTDIRALPREDELWLFWPVPDAELAQRVLALPGADLLCRSDGLYHRPGQFLPVLDVPDPWPGRPLSALLFPAPVVPIPPGPTTSQTMSLALIRDATLRPTTSLRLPLADLARWATDATSLQIESIEVACCEGLALLRGQLPALPGERFWGKRVLIPAGYRPKPALAEEVLCQALRLAAEEVALLGDRETEVIPETAFGPVSRASLRRAAGVQPV